MSAVEDHKNFVAFSEKEWVEFLSHRLPTEKEAEFIKISKNHEFSSDALEGIEQVPNRAHVLSSINNINSKIKTRTEGSSEITLTANQFNYVRMAVIAATLILVIGIGSVLFYFMNNIKQETVAETKAQMIESTNENPVPEILSDAVAIAPVLNDTSVLMITQKKEDIKSIAGNTAALTTAPVPPVTAAIIKKDLDKKSKDLEITIQDAKLKSEESAEIGKTSKTASSIGIEKESAPSMAASPTLSEVLAEKKVSIFKDEANTTINLYQTGIDEMNKGNSEEAIKNFDKVISQNSGFKVDAKWYKAQLLLKKGEHKKALKILKELSENENPYRNRAKDMLKSLE